MLDFDFEIRYKKGAEMPADFLSRSFQQTCAISILVKDWVDMQEKDKGYTVQTYQGSIREEMVVQISYANLVQESRRTG